MVEQVGVGMMVVEELQVEVALVEVVKILVEIEI